MDSSSDRWATFDCYGTLIDWRAGIRSTFSSLWPDADLDRLLERYSWIEPELEQDSSLPYREVLTEALRKLAGEQELPLRPEDAAALVESLPTWPVFDEGPGVLARLREDGWRLAILSNTDPDLLEHSIHAIGVPFDTTVTAQEAGSYKPRPGHWNAFFETTGADKDRHVHVAASVLGDLWPAAEMGLRCVWINRLSEVTDFSREAELPDLSELPDVLGRLIPPME